MVNIILFEHYKNIQQYSLETKIMYRPENLSEDLKTWSYDNSLPNNTTYKFTVMQREGIDPILGGGDILIEGHKSYSGYEWQKATCYSNGNPKKIFFRDKNNNAWSDWDRITTNSDITGVNVEITTETLFTPEKYNRAIKNNSMVFLNIAGVANISSTSTWTKIMTLPPSYAPLTDVFGCVILNGTSDVIPVYIASNGYVYISPPIVLSNKGIRGSLCYFIGK